MRGFEIYSPVAWLEGVFTVPVREANSRRPAEPIRSGKWSTQSAGRIAFVVGAAVVAVAGPSALTLFASTNDSAQVVRTGKLASASGISPPGSASVDGHQLALARSRELGREIAQRRANLFNDDRSDVDIDLLSIVQARLAAR